MSLSKVSCKKFGCKCSQYTISKSKWSKGRCRTCNHTRLEHEGSLIEQHQITSKNNTAEVGHDSNDSPSPPPPNDDILNSPQSCPPIKPPQQFSTKTNTVYKHVDNAIKSNEKYMSANTKHLKHTNRKHHTKTTKLNKLDEKSEHTVNIEHFKRRHRRGAFDSGRLNKKHARSVTVLKKQAQPIKKHNKSSNSNTLNRLNSIQKKLKSVSNNLKSNKKSTVDKNKVIIESKQQEKFDENMFKRHDSLIKQNAFQQIENHRRQSQKWKLKYSYQNKKLQQLRQENLGIEKEKQELNDMIQRLQDEIELYRKTPNTDKVASTLPNNKDEECHDILVKNEDNYTDYKWTDEEVCELLQQDLENYMSDQKKNLKTQWRREQKDQIKNKEKNKEKKKQRVVLKDLQLFPENKAEIWRDWIALKKNYFQGLFEKYEETLEEKYEDDEECIDSERIAYHIVFDVVCECFNVMHMEFNKLKQNMYDNANVINIVIMNIRYFYELSQLPIDNKMGGKLKTRIGNIYTYIEHKIDEIYKNVKNTHEKNVDDNIEKMELCEFMVRCCEIIWNVLYYNYTIYPLNFLFDKTDGIYNETMHEREGLYNGNNIQYCVFPAIFKQNKTKESEFKTKIWVLCDDMD